jgi:hypothetical protein
LGNEAFNMFTEKSPTSKRSVGGRGSYEEHLQKRGQFRYQLQSLVKRGMESGEFRKDLRADITTLTILGAANWSLIHTVNLMILRQQN